MGATFEDQAERDAAAQFDGPESPLGPEVPPGQIDLDGHEEPQPAPDEILVAGTQQSLFNVGGKHASGASLRLMGGAYKLLEGQGFAKGDVIEFSGTAVITDVGQRDKRDGKTRRVVSAEQYHNAEITDLRVSGAE
jgi:hypothetical protein